MSIVEPLKLCGYIPLLELHNQVKRNTVRFPVILRTAVYETRAYGILRPMQVF